MAQAPASFAARAVTWQQSVRDCLTLTALAAAVGALGTSVVVLIGWASGALDGPD